MSKAVRLPSKQIHKHRVVLPKDRNNRFIFGKLHQYNLQSSHTPKITMPESRPKSLERVNILPVKSSKEPPSKNVYIQKYPPQCVINTEKSTHNSKKARSQNLLSERTVGILRKEIDYLWSNNNISSEYRNAYFESIKHKQMVPCIQTLAIEIDKLEKGVSFVQNLNANIEKREIHIWRLEESSQELHEAKARDDLNKLRDLTLAVGESAINLRKQLANQCGSAKGSKKYKRFPIMHEGRNYLMKMMSDTEFLSESEYAKVFTIRRNNDPFLLAAANLQAVSKGTLKETQIIALKHKNSIAELPITSQLLKRIKTVVRVLLKEQLQNNARKETHSKDEEGNNKLRLVKSVDDIKAMKTNNELHEIKDKEEQILEEEKQLTNRVKSDKPTKQYKDSPIKKEAKEDVEHQNKEEADEVKKKEDNNENEEESEIDGKLSKNAPSKDHSGQHIDKQEEELNENEKKDVVNEDKHIKKEAIKKEEQVTNKKDSINKENENSKEQFYALKINDSDIKTLLSWYRSKLSTQFLAAYSPVSKLLERSEQGCNPVWLYYASSPIENIQEQIENESFDDCIKGLAVFNIDPFSKSNPRILILHASFIDKNIVMGEFIKQLIDYIWERNSCNEIRVELSYAHQKNGKLIPYEDLKNEYHRLQFKWRTLINDKDGNRNVALSLTRPKNNLFKNTVGIDYTKEPITFKNAITITIGNDIKEISEIDFSEPPQSLCSCLEVLRFFNEDGLDLKLKDNKGFEAFGKLVDKALSIVLSLINNIEFITIG